MDASWRVRVDTHQHVPQISKRINAGKLTGDDHTEQGGGAPSRPYHHKSPIWRQPDRDLAFLQTGGGHTQST